jgi:hypothetical protein
VELIEEQKFDKYDGPKPRGLENTPETKEMRVSLKSAA